MLVLLTILPFLVKKNWRYFCKKSGEWTITHLLALAHTHKKNDETKKARGLGRKTRGERNQMATLWFQTGDTLALGLPFRGTYKEAKTSIHNWHSSKWESKLHVDPIYPPTADHHLLTEHWPLQYTMLHCLKDFPQGKVSLWVIIQTPGHIL